MSETTTSSEKKPALKPKNEKQEESVEALQKQGDVPEQSNPSSEESNPEESHEAEEETKVVKDPTAKFIESKPELSRYSMAQVFREFVIKNFERFGNFKSESDYESAFKEFWGEKK